MQNNANARSWGRRRKGNRARRGRVGVGQGPDGTSTGHVLKNCVIVTYNGEQFEQCEGGFVRQITGGA